MGIFKSFFSMLSRPSSRYAVGSLVGVGLLAGILATTTFGVALEKTNTTEFCISCHTMKDTPYQEYKESRHFKNASGVSAGCADCHVPKEFVPKMRAKIIAAKDVWHEMLGTIDTSEKFEERRLQMAERVWAQMERSDSATCRSCHSWDSMDYEGQALRASRQHQEARAQGETCIDCHKGVAHEEPLRETSDSDGADFDMGF